MDDQGEYCWPRQLDPYAMILPDISTDKFENRSVEAAFREKEDLEIASHFTSTLNRIAQLHDKKTHHHSEGHHHSRGERIFSDKPVPHKEDPTFTLLETVLGFGSTLHKAEIFDAKYFELFNILFGVPTISLESYSHMTLEESHNHLEQCIAQARRTQKSFFSMQRKRKLQIFLEHHITDIKKYRSKNLAHSAENQSLNLFKKQTDSHIQNANLSDHLSNQSSKDEKRIGHHGLYVKEDTLIRESISNFNNDFLACYLSLLQSLDRETGLESLFSNSKKVCSHPHFPRKGDEVIFELLRLFDLLTKNEKVSLNLKFALLPTTSSVLRWVLGQYLRNPLTFLSPTDPLIQATFSIEGFSNVELLNLCSVLSQHGFKAEQLFVVCFSSFEPAEKLSWEQYCRTLAAEAAKDLLHKADLKHLLVSAGIPKNIIDSQLAQYSRSKGKFSEAISYFLDCNDYEKALDLFIKTQLSKLVGENSNQSFNFLSIFRTETIRMQTMGKGRKIVEILSIYFRFIEFYTQSEDVDPDDLKKFVKELLIRLPSLSSFSEEDKYCMKVIMNDVFQKVAKYIFGFGSNECVGANFLDREILNRMVSNSSFMQVLEIDSALAQTILVLKE